MMSRLGTWHLRANERGVGCETLSSEETHHISSFDTGKAGPEERKGSGRAALTGIQWTGVIASQPVRLGK